MFHTAATAVSSDAIGGSFPHISTLALIVQGSPSASNCVSHTTAFFFSIVNSHNINQCVTLCDVHFTLFSVNVH